MCAARAQAHECKNVSVGDSHCVSALVEWLSICSVCVCEHSTRKHLAYEVLTLVECVCVCQLVADEQQLSAHCIDRASVSAMVAMRAEWHAGCIR